MLEKDIIQRRISGRRSVGGHRKRWIEDITDRRG